jgi:ABC-type multidrug transport system ATPase subunit
MESVVVESIDKSFGPTKALESISFAVQAGTLFGLIGPDGAGKSTLFRILTTLLLADRGTATVAGYDVVKKYTEIRNIVGYMPGRFSLYQDLTVQENLAFFASIFGTTIQENYHLIKDIYQQIEAFKDRRAGKLSGGMKQKLALCCALIHKPEVLFLDEPTTGVDPVSRKEFWEMLKHLKAQGITILVSTPYMDEASLCDRVAFIQGGKILTIDSPEAITRKFTKPLFAVKAKNMYKLITDLRSFAGADSCYSFGEYAHLTTTHQVVAIPQISEFLHGRGHTEVEITQTPVSIEDSFIDLMQTSGQA